MTHTCWEAWALSSRRINAGSTFLWFNQYLDDGLTPLQTQRKSLQRSKMSGPFNSGFTYFLENNNLGRIGISLRCCIRALPVVCENKWPVLHISYMTDEPWRLPLWRWLLSQTVRLLILELYSSSFHPQKESILFEPNISKCRKCFLSLKLESY